MFEDINTYIQRPREERTAHLELSDPCILIGGADSRHYRGLLAHSLKTTIPAGMKIVLCHACNVHACSNPKHLYWGTAKENTADQKAAGTWQSMYARGLAKYGEETWKEMRRAAASKGGKANRKE